jgi:small-conductance mechanosensitive channel
MPAGVISPWLKGSIFFAAWSVVLIAVMRIAYARLQRLSRMTRTDLDDVILGALSLPLMVVILVSGGYILTKFLTLSPAWDKGLGLAAKIAFVLAGSFFFDRLARGLLQHYSTKADYLRASSGVIQVGVRAVVGVVALLVILETAGVAITPLIASLGVGSLALALALQSTLANFFAGLQLVADKPARIGQYIKLGSGEEGQVTRIGWRSTTILSPSGNCVVVPNSKVVDSVITNFDRPDKETSVVVPVGVHPGSDLERVERVTCDVARQVLREVAGGVKTYEPLVRYNAFGEFSVNFNVILRAEQFGDSYILRHEFIKRLHKRYREEGIVIPVPMRSLDFRREDLLLLKEKQTD